MCLPVFAFISLKFLWLQMSPLYLLLGQAQRLSPQATVIPGMKPVVSTSFYPPRVPTGDWPLKQAGKGMGSQGEFSFVGDRAEPTPTSQKLSVKDCFSIFPASPAPLTPETLSGEGE